MRIVFYRVANITLRVTRNMSHFDILAHELNNELWFSVFELAWSQPDSLNQMLPTSIV